MAAEVRGSKTILVVDDEPGVLLLVKAILQSAGYDVLTADSPEAALMLDKAFMGDIHLLLSDVMMPGMSGPALSQQIKGRRPELRVVFMSGFSDGSMLILNYGWSLIQKPFLPAALLARVSDVLQEENREQGPDHFDTRVPSPGD